MTIKFFKVYNSFLGGHTVNTPSLLEEGREGGGGGDFPINSKSGMTVNDSLFLSLFVCKLSPGVLFPCTS